MLTTATAFATTLLVGASQASALLPRATPHPLPARYNGSLSGATWLYAPQNAQPYDPIPIQALNGTLVFTQEHPQRVCPCPAEIGGRNWTAYYNGGTDAVPTLQLFTNSSGEQTVYVGRDLMLHYTAPGEPIPEGANATSISLSDGEPLGGGLPSGSTLDVVGFVTQKNGTRTYYNNLQFCPEPGKPASTTSGQGPLRIFVIPTTAEDPTSNTQPWPNCIGQTIFNTDDDPKAVPKTPGSGDIVFVPPKFPPVESYVV